MSKLEELIQKYCPDGVEWKTLGEATLMKRGTSATKGVMQEGNIPVISGGRQPAFYCNQSNRTGETITVAGSGAGAGYVQYWNEPIFVCDAFSVQGNEDLNTKFIYYYMTSMQDKIYATKKGGGVPHVHISSIDKFEIPIPPLPVQEEIVRILDTFTELQAELQAELQKRLQQYNYYRDNLLSDFTPEQEPKECTLEEITTDIYSGATPSKEKRDYWENGTIPWMSSGEVNLGQVYEVEGRITQLGYDKCSTRMVPEGSVVIALAGQGKTRGTVAILRTSVCTNQSLAALVPNPDIVSGEYLYYYLKTQYSKLREVSSGDGTRGGLNLKMLRSYKVIVPSLKTQTQIVAILDRFETLTNDLSAGLPAEIEKRRQQYEYYRDKLLTFKKKEA